MRRLLKSSKIENGDHEERAWVVEEVQQAQREQHQDHDGRPIEQTRKWNNDPGSQKRRKDHGEWEAERQANERHDPEAGTVGQGTGLDLQRGKEKDQMSLSFKNYIYILQQSL